MKTPSFNYHGKNIYLEIQKCKSFFSKLRGLMFRHRETCPAMLFEFKTPTKISIHSFFVFFKFVAVWFDNKNNIVDMKIVKPFKFSVSQKNKFYKLLEIPFNKKYSGIIKFLVGDAKDL